MARRQAFTQAINEAIEVQPLLRGGAPAWEVMASASMSYR